MPPNVRENVSLAPLTTFEIGGSAQYFVEVRNHEEILAALKLAKQRNLTPTVLSGGSNVLVPNNGLTGLVIHVAEGRYQFSDYILRADAGCNLSFLIREAATRNAGGWEKLAGIPGSIGGAVRGNAGAFGSEIKDVISVARAINSKTLDTRSFVNPYMALSYRNSYFKQHPEWIITTVTVQLQVIRSEDSLKIIEETIAERERRHLQNVKAAGSFFMNPVAPVELVALFETEKKVKARSGRVPAGWLIEKAGLKGATVGGASASEQHPNYIVNMGTATAADVLSLASRIKYEVKKQFNIDLVEEAVVL